MSNVFFFRLTGTKTVEEINCKQVTPDSSANRDLHHLEITLSPPTSSSTLSPPQSNDFSLTQAPSSTDFSFTQETISSVQKDIQELKGSFNPSISSRHQVVVKMGEEVRKLKKEVGYLRHCLDNSVRHQQILKRRLSFFEDREEEELVRQSMEYDEHKEAMRRQQYSQYAKRKFSPNSNFLVTLINKPGV